MLLYIFCRHAVSVKKCCFSLWLLCTGSILLAAPNPQITYTISPLKAGDYTSFSIKMMFKGSPSGKTLVSIPYEDGLYHPQEHIALQHVSNSYKHGFMPGDSSVYLVAHQPNAALTITYTIKNALKDSLPAADEVNAQMLTNTYFYVLGSSLWIVPADSTSTTYNIALNWKGFPKDWKYLNSFGANKLHQSISAPLQDFQHAIYMGGDIRIHTLMINGKPLLFGIRGQWNFKDEQVFDIIRKTASTQRAYWNDYAVESYTIGFIPMKLNSANDRNIIGRGLTNTFVTVGTNSKAFVLDDLVFLYNHELMHHWLGYVLKQATPENAYKWFHEGFTDYFAHAAMLEGGLLTEADFKKRINEIFAAYYSDSTHQMPNKTLEEGYWSSHQMQQLPYKRGLIFAFYLQESIQYHSKGKASLKEVMQHLFADARGQANVFSQEKLLHYLHGATGQDYAPLLKRFITEGHFITMEDWKAVTGKMALSPTEVYDIGFTTDRGIAVNAVITTINEGANVGKAGLRTGDILVGFSARQQPTDTATMTVKRGEDKIKLQFLPSRQIWVPQLK